MLLAVHSWHRQPMMTSSMMKSSVACWASNEVPSYTKSIGYPHTEVPDVFIDDEMSFFRLFLSQESKFFILHSSFFIYFYNFAG